MKVETVIIFFFFAAKIQAKLEDCSIEGITWSSNDQLTVIPLIQSVEECAILCSKGKWLHTETKSDFYKQIIKNNNLHNWKQK